MNEMTMRERMLAVIEGRDHDRVPLVQYWDCVAPNEDVWALVGRENMGVLHGVMLFRLESPNCKLDTEEIEVDGKTVYRTTLRTPQGTLCQEQVHAAEGIATTKHYVATPEDLDVMLAYLRDTVVHKEIESWHDVQKKLGDDGLPHTWVNRTPYQKLWIEWTGINNLILLMADQPDRMDQVFSILFDIQRRTFEAACEVAQEVPVPYIGFPDNITAPMVGEPYFRKYCLSSYRELAGMIEDRGLDTLVACHMDGDLKPLWNAITESPLRLIDSLSPPPANDTSAADAVRLWPETRIGLNFPSPVFLSDPKTIRDTAMEILEQAGHTGKLQIQISEDPPAGTWQKGIPEIVRAIHDFAGR